MSALAPKQPLPQGTSSPHKLFSDGKGDNAPLTHYECPEIYDLTRLECAIADDLAMNDLTRGERLQIMLTKEELEALDSWRFSRRMPSRAAAIRELLKRGLAAEGFNTADGGSKSQDFGVTGKSTASGQDTPGE